MHGIAPWREISAVDAAGFSPVTAPPEAAISVLGHTGRTAFLGVKHIMRPSSGNIAYVTGAAGATGLAACQTLLNLGQFCLAHLSLLENECPSLIRIAVGTHRTTHRFVRRPFAVLCISLLH